MRLLTLLTTTATLAACASASDPDPALTPQSPIGPSGVEGPAEAAALPAPYESPAGAPPPAAPASQPEPQPAPGGTGLSDGGEEGDGEEGDEECELAFDACLEAGNTEEQCEQMAVCSGDDEDGEGGTEDPCDLAFDACIEQGNSEEQCEQTVMCDEGGEDGDEDGGDDPEDAAWRVCDPQVEACFEREDADDATCLSELAQCLGMNGAPIASRCIQVEADCLRGGGQEEMCGMQADACFDMAEGAEEA